MSPRYLQKIATYTVDYFDENLYVATMKRGWRGELISAKSGMQIIISFLGLTGPEKEQAHAALYPALGKKLLQ